MNATNSAEQASLDGIPDVVPGTGHLIARVSAVAVKLVFPFAAQHDLRYYLNGINLRPLNDGSVMAAATLPGGIRTVSSSTKSSSASIKTRSSTL